MKSSPAKRFWKKSALVEVAGGTALAIVLDDKELRSPKGNPLHLPPHLRRLGEAICDEWDSQKETIDVATMPLWGFTAAAVDLIAPARDATIKTITAYGGSDLLCYREDASGGDADLRARQDALWQPFLDALAQNHGVELQVFAGLMPRPQPPAALAKLHDMVAGLDEFRLTGLQDFTGLSGSLVLGLAVLEGGDVIAATEAALLDDSWNEEKWGYDSEAAKRIAALRANMDDAARYLALLREADAEANTNTKAKTK